jgi:hypothetical protein
MFLDKLQDFFDYYAISIVSHRHWLEINAKPLPWNVPFGVILDGFTPFSFDSMTELKHKENNSKNSNFILEVTLHYRDYPSDLLPCDNLLKVKNYFIHSLKDSSLGTHNQ